MILGLSKLEQLKQFTIVVADTGDIESIATFKPTDCTTNPTLILKAAQMPIYAAFVDEAVHWAQRQPCSNEARILAACERLAVTFGTELTKLVPGRVSTEVDADLSFDTEASVTKARSIIADYATRGVGHERILIKLAATWEGIRAAEILQKEGIDCNLTLVFSLEQAIACAQAKVFLISPFVGRILDWHVKLTGETYTSETDPGVLSVRSIFDHYRRYGYKTVVMGASFRNLGEIEALAGCDRLTIAPQLLDALSKDFGVLEAKLDRKSVMTARYEEPVMSEQAFRFALNENAMAVEKLSEGIRGFVKDLASLKHMVAEKLT
jgi:transaldolase